MVEKILWVEKSFWVKTKFWSKQSFGSKKFLIERILGQNFFELNKFFGFMFGQKKKIYVKNFFGENNFWVKIIILVKIQLKMAEIRPIVTKWLAMEILGE